MTSGTYRVFRAVTYPRYPDSLILFDAEVHADASVWSTTIYVNGTYDGPADVVGCKDYRIGWMADDHKLRESGAVDLELSSGERLHQRWSSIITPSAYSDDALEILARFPSEGEVVHVSISPFEVDERSLRYKWDGTVRKTAEAG